MTDLKAVLAAFDEFSSTFDKLPGTTPPPLTADLKGVGDDVSDTQPSLRGILNDDDRMYMQNSLVKLPNHQLVSLFYKQLKKDNGIPVSQSWDYQTQVAMGMDPAIKMALDTGTTALQRQDLEPILYSIFIKNFPAFERMRKEPANGVVHTWNQITAYGDAQFMAELGTVVDDTGTYVRQTTNIAQLGTRRGVTFKEQLAVPAGGMNWNPGQLEIENGLTAMAHKLQKTIFQGQASNSGGTANNELGAYDANGFTGLRSILNVASAVNFEPYLTSNPDNFVSATNSALTNVTNDVGVAPSVVFMRAGESAQFTDQQLSIQRIVDRTEFIPGVQVPAIATTAGILPIIGVPGDSIGTYVTTNSDGPFSGGETVADIYLLNESTVTLPYLGSPGPSVLEIPPGVSGQLTRFYIIWCLMGLAVKSIPNNVKLRANTATS